MKRLSKKKEEIMNLFWSHGKMYVRELRELYPDPKPHFNTLSTQVRSLESDGYIKHEAVGANYRYYPALSREEYSNMSLSGFIGKYFCNSYMNVVSSFVSEEKISLDELKELIHQIEESAR